MANAEPTITTSFDREEIYLVEHSIHHFALIRIALKTYFSSIKIDDNFGVAPSTIAYRLQNQTAICAY